MPLPSFKLSSAMSKKLRRRSSVLSSASSNLRGEEEDCEPLLTPPSRPQTAASSNPSSIDSSHLNGPDYLGRLWTMPGTGPGASLEPSTHHPEAISEIDWPYTFLGDTETEPANWGKNSTDADKTHHPTQMKPASCSVSYLGNTDVSVHERFDIILSKGEEGGIRWQIAGVEVSLRAFELPLGAKKGAKADEARKKWKHSWELIPEGLGCQLFVKHCSEATKLANDAEWWICRIDIEKDSKKVTYKANDGVKVEVEYRTNTPTLGRKPVKLPNPRKEDEAKDERRLPSVPMA